MKISFFGSSLVSAYWNGAATYYRGIIRALHARGHNVCFYEPDAYDRQLHRDLADPEWARVVVYAPTTAGVESALDAAAGNGAPPDFVIKASGVGVFDEYLEAAVVELRSRRTRTIFWDVDAPATLDRVCENPLDPFAPLISRYDLVLTYGGGSNVTKKYLSLGARRCVPVYNGLDPETHYRVGPDERFRADLAFMGNRLPDREQRVDQFFTHAARRLPGRRFLLGGNGWEPSCVPSNVTCAGHVYTRDHNAFNSTPLAVLNISRDSMARYGHSPATRVFEAAGAAACIITDQWDGVAEFFEPGKEWLVARDGDEVAGIVQSLTPERAAAIGEAAQRRVLAEHTYVHRAAVVEQLLNEVR